MTLKCSRFAFRYGRTIIAAALALAAVPALADIDMQLNTSNFVAGQASTLSVDGTVTASGDSTAITATTITVRFDPAKITLSNLHVDSSTAWTLLAYNTDHLADGWAKAVLLNTDADGQTADGPILLFTVTPVDSTVDANDCDTLKISASESDMADQGFNSITPTDACAGTMAPNGPSMTTETNTPQPSLPTIGDCGTQLNLATRALKIAGGLEAATLDDIALLDQDGDQKITIADSALVASPWKAEVGWYMFQGNRRHTGRSPWEILSPSNPSPAIVEDWHMALGLGYGATPPLLPPSLVAVPDPADPIDGDTLVYAALSNKGAVESNTVSQLFRGRDIRNADGTFSGTHNSISSPQLTGVVFTGTPLVYNCNVYLTANAYGSDGTHARLYSIDLDLQGPWRLVTDFGAASTVYSSPVPNSWNGGILLTANTGGSGYLYCVDPETGGNLWTPASLSGTATTSSPAVNGGGIYVSDSTTHLRVVSLNGTSVDTLVADDTSSMQTYNSPAILGNNVFYGTVSSVVDHRYLLWWRLHTYDLSADFFQKYSSAPETNAPVWQQLYPGLALHAESHSAFFSDDSGQMVGLDTNYTGSGGPEKWPYTRGITEYCHASTVVAGNAGSTAAYAFQGTDNGNLYVFKAGSLPDAGQANGAIHHLDVTNSAGGSLSSTPAAFRGRLYTLTTQGVLSCLRSN